MQQVSAISDDVPTLQAVVKLLLPCLHLNNLRYGLGDIIHHLKDEGYKVTDIYQVLAILLRNDYAKVEVVTDEVEVDISPRGIPRDAFWTNQFIEPEIISQTSDFIVPTPKLEELIENLTVKPVSKNKKQGRPSYQDKSQDQELFEIWKSGKYKNKRELAKDKGLKLLEVEQAIDRARKRAKN